MSFKKSNNSIKKSNNKPSIGQTIGHSMASGFGLGTGLEASRAVIGGLFGSSNSNDNDTICKFEKEKLDLCLNSGGTDCKDLMELLNNCYKSQK